ncbi:MAG: hypothetical protein GY903_34240 [Fuerstiella sp.]|nr:hypothetical protein [Fuerstiella sp.]MCP4859552.1 hypothetical protein [Fuerstiella sp.]
MKLSFDILRATFVVCGCCVLIQTTAIAQSSRDRKRVDDTPSAKSLEVRLEKAEEALVNEYKDVAIEFYKQGDKEKSMAMLRRLRQLSPQMAGLKERIGAINEELMEENAFDLEIDTRKTWELVGDVSAGKPFRIQAAGEYKLTYSTTVTVDGLPADKDSKEHVAEAPLGCLLGVIVSDGKPGKPFPVKAELRQTPKKGGQFFLKVNVPAGTRCIGKLKIHASGYLAPPSHR